MGPILILLCGFLSLVGLAAPVVSFVRHRQRGLVRALAGLPAAVLVWAWVSLYLGMLERVWSIWNLWPWLLGVLGGIGVFLLILSVRTALRARFGPGQCRVCGYPCEGMERCPECGRSLIAGATRPGE